MPFRRVASPEPARPAFRVVTMADRPTGSARSGAQAALSRTDASSCAAGSMPPPDPRPGFKRRPGSELGGKAPVATANDSTPAACGAGADVPTQAPSEVAQQRRVAIRSATMVGSSRFEVRP